MSFSPAFDRPLPRIEASLRWRTNKERLFRMRCHSVVRGTASQTQSATQSITQSFSVDHIAL